ncbi:hypothetical protein THRCLA_07307 [Thraustotheca clavata]|uniref:Secreted protein n=1 Tax=Thraustotheca clavata TaxID=74557 RepID=A0A0A7CM98_9STRA|nr:secreted protein [Thraustotheca clavata]OQR96349.1 hypothetical protein THRCLA_07307 [Thraustotheca clavata]
MKASFALVTLLAALASFGVEADTMQAASCAAAKCPTVKGKGSFCSAASQSPTAFTTFANQCECLKAKCKDRKVQCYAQAAKCDVATLQELKGKPATTVAPSCASNGITYDNYYHLKVARALDPNIQFIISGKCPTNIKTCIKKKCPQTPEKICAVEKAGKSPVFYQNQCFFDVGKCLNPSLTVSKTCPPKSKKAKALSAENTFALADNSNVTTPDANSTSSVVSSTSGSGSYDEPLDEEPYTDGDDFYVGMDLMGSYGSSSGSFVDSNGTIISSNSTNVTTQAPATSSAVATTISVGALAITAFALN